MERNKDEEEEVKDSSSYASELFVFTNQKAGMEHIDKEKVNKVVYEMSKDSSFFKNSLRHDERTVEKVKEMQEKLKTITPLQRNHNMKVADKILQDLEARRDLSRIYIVCDMDMFYAAVEMRDDPSLKEVPLAVGGYGMISTTNYIARKFGVRAAMPGFIGKKLCPDLVFVKPNFDKYTAVAQDFRAVFAEYDPNFKAWSLDEAILDITEYYNQHKERYSTEGGERSQIICAISNEIRQKIFDKTKLTASAGISCNETLAKVCSDLNKPDGQYYLPNDAEAILAFVDTLSVRKFTGVGKVMEKMLDGLGIKTGRDLYEKRADVVHVFKPLTYRSLLRLSRGIQSESKASDEMKSMSKEQTFRETDNRDQLLLVCRKLSFQVADLLKEREWKSSHVTMKLKSADFSVITRATTLDTPIQSGEEIYIVASKILLEQKPSRLRLIGIRVASFISTNSHNQISSVSDTGQQTISQFCQLISPTKDARADEDQEMTEFTLSCESADIGSPDRKLNQVTLTQLAADQTSCSSPLEHGWCPICGTELVLKHNWTLNRHIDSCLELPSVDSDRRKRTPTSSRHDKSKTKRNKSILDFVVHRKDHL